MRLQEWSLEHVEQLTDACQDADIQRRLPVPVPYTTESAMEFITVVAPTYASSGGGNWAVVEDKELLGCISLVPLGDGLGRLGYWVSARHRGRGVARKAVELAGAWARDNGFAELELTIGADNPASARVARASGFCEVERMPDYQISKGLHKDTIRFRRKL